MRAHLRRNRRKLFSPTAWRVRLVFWAGAVLVGGVCSLFAALADQAGQFFNWLVHLRPWIPLAVTPLTLVIVLWLTRTHFPGSQGSGIPQAIAALDVQRKKPLLSHRIALGKILLTLAGLAAGASIGREGPSVHIGASIMHSLGRIARFPAHYMERGLILAGGAAGISAAFNTPLAGIVFAIEEMSRSYEQRTSGLVTVAVVLAGVTALAIAGPYTYFGISFASMSPSAWLAAPLCGAVGGLLGGLFAQALIHGGRVLAPALRDKPYLVALACGLALAAIGWQTGYLSSGTGYEAAKAIVSGVEGHRWDPFYPIAKAFATMASYWSGIPGGIFAPTLATGAGLGADLGHWLPVAPMSTMVLLGMVAYFSGVVQAPLTAFVIVMEMTDNQDMLLALIVASLVAKGASNLVCPKPLYHALSDAFRAGETGGSKVRSGSGGGSTPQAVPGR